MCLGARAITLRSSRLVLAWALAPMVCGLLAAPGPVSADEPGASASKPKVDFNREVRPILAKNCFACHGQDEAKRAKGLRLDVRESAIKPLKSGEAAIVPGDPDSSELIARLTEEDETLRMPPEEDGQPAGAGRGRRPPPMDRARGRVRPALGLDPARVAPPADGPRPAWPRNGIDSWILARLEQEGLKPSPEADRLYAAPPRQPGHPRPAADAPPRSSASSATRPPAPTSGPSTASSTIPAYGERWARIWLDLARYADSAGYGSDPLRPDIWRYRDWVIDAFNRNLPYDRFTLVQIAGDLLPDPSLEDRIATAFHRNTMTNTEGGTDDEEFRVAAIKDRVDTTMQVWMGLTIGCAKCHSHKYDPITQEEYYRFYAIFNQTADADRGDESPTVPAPTPELSAKVREADARIAALKAKLTKTTPAAEAAKIKAEIAAMEKARPKVPNVPVMVELPEKQKRTTRLLRKGNFLDPGDPVQPGVPAALHPLPSGTPVNRLTPGPMAGRPEEPADGAGRGQSVLGAALRRGAGRDRGGLRHAGRAAQPPRAARLAGGPLPRFGLGHQGPPAADRHLGDVPAIVAGAAGAAGEGPAQPAAGARAADPARGRDGPRPGAGPERPAEPQGRRPERLPAPARRALAGGVQRRAHLGDQQGRRPVSPRAVRVLAADGALSLDGRVRRAQPRDLRHQAGADEYAAPVVRHAE